MAFELVAELLGPVVGGVELEAQLRVAREHVRHAVGGLGPLVAEVLEPRRHHERDRLAARGRPPRAAACRPGAAPGRAPRTRAPSGGSPATSGRARAASPGRGRSRRGAAENEASVHDPATRQLGALGLEGHLVEAVVDHVLPHALLAAAAQQHARGQARELLAELQLAPVERDLLDLERQVGQQLPGAHPARATEAGRPGAPTVSPRPAPRDRHVRRHGLERLAPEELLVAGAREAPEQHQHQTHQGERRGNEQRHAHPEHLGSRVGVAGIGEEARRLEEQVDQHRRADQRGDAHQHQVLGRLAELAAVVDRAGDAAERVVEGDHQRQRGDAVEQEVVGHQPAADVPDDRQDADGDRGDVRGEVALVHAAEDLRERARARHREDRSRGGQDRGLRRGEARGDDRQDHQEREAAQHVLRHACRARRCRRRTR